MDKKSVHMETILALYSTENIHGKKYELLGLVKGSMIQSKHLALQ